MNTTTNNAVHFSNNEVNDMAFISTYIEGEYVEASITRPRTMELGQEGLLEELQDQVWWKKLEI